MAHHDVLTGRCQPSFDHGQIEEASRGTAGAGIRSRFCCWILIASNMSTIRLAMRLAMRCCAKRPFA